MTDGLDITTNMVRAEPGVAALVLRDVAQTLEQADRNQRYEIKIEVEEI